MLKWIYKLINHFNISDVQALLKYYPIPPHHASVSAQPINKTRSMSSSILITQRLRQLKVQLRQNLYSTLTDINQELGIQKSSLLQKKVMLFNTTQKLKV